MAIKIRGKSKPAAPFKGFLAPLGNLPPTLLMDNPQVFLHLCKAFQRLSNVSEKVHLGPCHPDQFSLAASQLAPGGQKPRHCRPDNLKPQEKVLLSARGRSLPQCCHPQDVSSLDAQLHLAALQSHAYKMKFQENHSNDHEEGDSFCLQTPHLNMAS